MGNSIIEMFKKNKTAAPQSNENELITNARNYVAGNGGDDRTAFMNLCKQYGINMPSNISNPEEALKVLVQQTGINPMAILSNKLHGR